MEQRCCRVKQFVAVCCSLLQCVVVCCSVLQCVSDRPLGTLGILLIESMTKELQTLHLIKAGVAKMHKML